MRPAARGRGLRAGPQLGWGARGRVRRVEMRQRRVKLAPFVPPLPPFRVSLGAVSTPNGRMQVCGMCRCGCRGAAPLPLGRRTRPEAALGPRFTSREVSVHRRMQLAGKACSPRCGGRDQDVSQPNTYAEAREMQWNMCFGALLRQQSPALRRTEKGRDRPLAVAMQG